MGKTQYLKIVEMVSILNDKYEQISMKDLETEIKKNIGSDKRTVDSVFSLIEDLKILNKVGKDIFKFK